MENTFSNLNELLLWRTEHNSGQLALTFLKDGEKEESNWTYEELSRRAWSVAALLQTANITGQPVLLLYPPGPDFIAAFWGCLSAGAIAVPVYPPRSNRNLLRLKAVINDSQARTVLTTGSTLAKIKSFADSDPQLGSLRYLPTDDLDPGLSQEWKPPKVTGDSIAFLQYTSGSTATPKGVIVSHSNLIENEALIQEAFHQSEKSVIVGWLPLYHDMGLIGNMLQPIYVGARCILMPPMAFLQQPSHWLQAITRYRATTSGGPNFSYDLCVRKITEDELATLDLSSWELAFNGAEPVRSQTMRRFAERFGPVGFKARAFTPCYGLAEATLLVSGHAGEKEPVILELDSDSLGHHQVRYPSEDSGVTRVVSCGQPAQGNVVMIVDPESLRPIPVNQVGEIWVSSPSVAYGYWNLPAETEKTFHAHIAGGTNEPFLRTGDLGFLRDGELFVTGRLKDLIIIRGRNYYPQDIEETMASAHSALRPGCGAAFAIEKDGEEQLIVVQEAAVRSDEELDKAIQLIARNVAEVHELTAHAIVLIQAGTIPKTSSGKLQRHACKKDFLNQRLEVLKDWCGPAARLHDVHARPSSDFPDRSAVETWVIGELTRRTGIEPVEVDVHQSLMSYGLNSLAAVEFCHKVQVHFGIEITSSDLFDGLTIAELEKRVNRTSALLTRRPASQLSTYQLSYGQRALWVVHQMAPESAVYNLSRAIRITSALDVEALRGAFQSLVDRHPCLRTTFVDTAGEPVQQVADKAEVCFEYVDCHTWSEAELERRLVEQSHLPFSLTKGPLFRTTLYARSKPDHLLHVGVHHIVADYWSLTLLLDEVGELYQAHHLKVRPQLLRLEHSYADFVEWQREKLSGPDGERLRDYWKEELSGELPPLSLPADHARPSIQTFHGSSLPCTLDARLTEKLKQFATEQQTTIFAMLLAAFQMLLYRLTSQKQIIVGCPIAGRSRAEFANSVGYFVNALPLRADFRQRQTFVELLSQVRNRAAKAFANDLYPFPLMVEHLGIARDPAVPPVFQSMFVLQQTYARHSDDFVRFALGQPEARVTLGGLQLQSVAVQRRTTQFDLTLIVGDGPDGLVETWEYNSDFFEHSTIVRWSENFKVLLQAVVQYPSRQVIELPMLSPAQRTQIVEEFNRTQTNYGGIRGVHEQIAQQAILKPDSVAVRYRTIELSYQQLEQRSNQVAHYLKKLGVGPDVRVGVCLDRSIELVVFMLGVLKAGSAYVPLDTGYPAERLQYMAQDAQAPVLIVGKQHVEQFANLGFQLICAEDQHEEIERESTADLRTKLEDDNLAYIIYTSGSTGRPKGAMNTHLGLRNRLQWMQEKYRLTSEDRVLQKTPFSFDVSVWEFFWPLMVGAQLVMAEPGRHQDPEYLGRAIEQQEVTTLHFVPSMLRAFLESGESKRCGKLRRIICSGEALSAELAQKCVDLIPAELHNLYGPTEAAIDVTYWPCRREDLASGSVPIGKPIANTQMYVLDAEYEPVPVGVEGEIYIGGVGLARGYWNRPELTAERFIANPLSAEAGARMYRTGDLGRWRINGNLEYLGRLDHQVKVRGFRIELGEIESRLLEHEGVREAVVVVREDTPGDKRLVAYLVPDKVSAHPLAQLLRLEQSGELPQAACYELPNGMVISHQNKSETDFVYQEIFERQSYLRHGISLGNDACVFDVGANIGLFTLAVLQRAPGARVYAFEPIPPVFESLRINALLSGGDVRLFNCGLSRAAGSADFTWFKHNSVISGRYADLAEEQETIKKFMKNQKTAEVSEDTLESLIQERLESEQFPCSLRTVSEVMAAEKIERIDLLKIDVEKSELEVFEGIEEQDWEKIGQLVIEVHDVDGRLGKMQRLLGGRGYEVSAEQDELLAATNLYTIYARRPGRVEQDDALVEASSRTPPVYWNPKQLTLALRAHLSAKLPEYMVPAAYVLIEKLPLTDNGKLDRKGLPAPDGEAYGIRSYEAPVGEIETMVAAIWAEVLKIERVGRGDNFFALGGHSLLATQVMSRVRQMFGVELQLRSFLANPTVAGLTLQVDRAARTAIPPMRPLLREQHPRLSFAQERLWFLSRYEVESSLYNVPVTLRLRGPLKIEALHASLQEIVARHQVLRTSFPEIDGGVIQNVAAAIDLSMPVVEMVESEMPQFIRQQARLQFDLAIGPVIRACLLQLGTEDHVLMVVLHHIACDGWSLGIMLQELTELYGAFSQGAVSPLAPLPAQYADFAEWQRQWLQGELLEKQTAYWKAQLEGVEPLNLPTDRPYLTKPTFSGATEMALVPKILAERLRTFSRQQGVTLFMTLLTGFKILLHRYSGQTDIAVGSPIANRTTAEVEPLIGFFVNTLVLRTAVAGDIPVAELLQQVREVSLQAYAHQDIPFERLVEALDPPRDLGHTPLFQTMFVLQNAPLPKVSWNGLETTARVLETGTSKFDLTLAVREGEEESELCLEYRTELFDADRMKRLLQHYRILLEGIVTSVESRIREIEILSQAERQQLLVEWNRTEAQFPLDKCVHELFEEQVALTPQAVAVVFEDTSLSYAELNRRANQLAHYLRTLLLGPEDRVGICAERSPEMVVGMLAILKAGGSYVPLDRAYPVERLRWMLEDSGATLLLVQEHLQGIFAGLSDALPVVALAAVAPAWKDERDTNPERDTFGVTAEHLAYVIYTSGSTGMPKGVMVPHRAINRLVLNNGYAKFEASDRVAFASNPAFDATTMEVWAPLLNGGCVVVIDQSVLLEPVRFGQTLKRHEVNILWLTVGLFNQYADALREEFSTLRYLIVGGDALDPRVITRVLEGNPPQHLLNGYGPTETTTFATTHEVTVVREKARSIPIGRPIANTRIYVLDKWGEPVPVGVVGELYIGGAGVARGYLNRPELTAERFLADPFSPDPDARMYRTGDLGRWLADGNIEFVGRNDFQVKIRGFRIELGEIEAKLSEHPGVLEAVVMAREDTPGDKRLVAYVRTQAGDSVDPQALRTHLAAVLPEYMVPAAYIQLATFPLTPNGKLDRKALSAPDSDAYVTCEYEAPVGEVESTLAQIWAEVLELERVGRHDNFFELGGHSLLATRLVTRVRSVFDAELSLRQLFESPTVGGLAEQVKRAAGLATEAGPKIERVSREQTMPLSSQQEQLWFLDQLTSGGPAYNLPAAVRLKGDLNKEALRLSFQEIVRRHEVLRTKFVQVGAKPQQQICEDARFELLELDLRDPISGIAAEERVNRELTEEAARPFVLTEGELFRVRLLRIGEQEHILLVTIHHIVFDGRSVGVLAGELSALYEAYSKGNPSPLADLEIQYTDYAAWQREMLEAGTLTEGLEYWKKQLEGVSMSELPMDHARPAVQSFRGTTEQWRLPVEIHAQLTTLSREHRVTLFMTLLAGLQILLTRYSGQEDIAIGSPIQNRAHPQLQSLIGFFVNTVVFRADLSGSPQVCEVLRRTREMCLAAYTHQAVPFDKLVEALEPNRDLSRNPLFQVAMVSQNAPAEAMQLPGIEMTLLPSAATGAKLDLSLVIEQSQQGLHGFVEYCTDIFEPETIRQMMRHYSQVLREMARDPKQSVSTLPFLTEAERHQLLYAWNDTATEFPNDQCIHELFEAQVHRTPQATAVVCGDSELSYAELNVRANRLAHYLRELGVKPDTPVALCVERSFEMIVGLLAVLKAGGGYVPLDPAYPAERLNYMLADSAPVALLTQGHLAGLFPEISAMLPLLDLTDASAWSNQPDTNPKRAAIGVTAEHIAYIIYTSGSTGQPKGVMVEHRNVVRLVRNVNYVDLSPALTIGHVSNVAFDASTFEIWGALLNGCRLAVIPKFDVLVPKDFARQLKDLGVSTLFLTTALFNECVRTYPGIFRGINQILFGGEACDPGCVRRALEEEPPQELVHVYGPTETTTFASYFPVRTVKAGNTVPIGRPLSNTQIYVLDEQLNPVPVGVEGELYIGGAGVARGYLNRPELTAERFVLDPFVKEPGARMYRTGDLGRWLPDGTIEFLGRNDFQVKIRGFRIELREIESRLLEHEGVREAVVVVREDTPGDKRLVAYLVPDKVSAHPLAQLLRLEQSGELPQAACYELPNGMVISHQNKSETDFVYQEIFERQSYLRHGITLDNDACVFDVGANIGLFTLSVLQQAPGARVYAFEPIPPVFESLRINALLSGGDIHLFSCGLSNATGSADFTWFKHNSVISGRYADLAEEQETIKRFMKNQNTAEVSEDTLESLIQERLESEQFPCSLRTVSEVMAAEKIERIDLLKIDVEKSELEVFEGIEEQDWAKIGQLVIEVHDVDGRLGKMQRLLGGRGYEVSAEQDELLAATNLYTIYARRPGRVEQDDALVEASSRTAPVYWNPKQLESALRAHLSAKLPSYMVPAAYIQLATFPLTPNGKIDRKALPRVKSALKFLEKAKAPVAKTEQIIADIWKQVLSIDEVGVEDKFFDVGGHSLLVPQVRLALQSAFGTNLQIVDLFQYPTIRSLAERIEAERTALEIKPAPREEKVKTEQLRRGTKAFAIVGMVCRLPGAGNVEEFWNNLQAGVESIVDFSDEELRAAGVGEELLASPHYIKRGSVVANADLFDARFFDISAREAELIDPQQRIFLECAWEALENAGYTAKSYPGKIGLYAGSGVNTYFLNLLTDGNSPYSMDAAPVLFANGNDFLATRVSYKLDLTGPSVTVQTACSTSLVAVDMACRALANHQCDIAMAGGITIRTSQNLGDIFQEGGIVSPDGHNRTFDERAQGTVRGNGAGIVVIKRLEDARRDGDHIRAVIKGSAINNDGANKVGFAAPSVAGQRDVIQQALLESGVSPETITYLEAHGTATSMGDPIEVSALTQAYRGMGAEKSAFCAVGSVKSNIGHADTAAGVAGLIKTVLALEHKAIPPTVHFERPNPKIDFLHSPFYVNAKLIEWTRENGPRRAGVSSFGIGGTNAHVILEEAPADDSISVCRPWQLVLLSAKTATALEAAASNLEAYLQKSDLVNLADVAHTLQVGRAAFAHRCFVVAESVADTTEMLRGRHARSLAGSTASREGCRVAFLFPGQGSQYVNMGKQLYAHEPLFRDLVDQCSDLLQPSLRLDLRSVLYPSSEQYEWAEVELRETRTTQPALFVIEYALARMWMSWGILPESMLGHSVGEYVAACLAGVFSLEDALKLVAVRGRLMQSCARGGMLAVAASEEQVQRYLKTGLELAASNGSTSCVLTGPLDALELAEKELAQQQVVHRRLQSSHAFHSAMMEPIVAQFIGEVQKVQLNAPRTRYLSNLTGDWITAEQATDPAYWGRQLRGTVQFASGIRKLCDGGGPVTLEVGPGHSNSTAVRQTIAKTALPVMLNSLPDSHEESDVKHVLTVLGNLWLQGAGIEWNAFASGEKRRRLPLPTYPFERQRYWVDAPVSRRSHADTSRRKLADWMYLPSWKETTRVPTGLEASTSDNTTVLMFAGNSGLAERLALRLEQKRYNVATVVTGKEFTKVDHRTYTICPTARADYDTLFAILREQGQLPQKILHLWNVGQNESLEQDLDFALYGLLHMVQAAAAESSIGPIQCMIVSSGLHGITGNESLAPAKATLLGLCKTIPWELPDFACKSVDIEVQPEDSWTEHSLLDQLVAELESKEQRPVVSYRGPSRWIQTFDQVPLEAGGSELVREGGVYLITGGLNDVGFRFAEWLASDAHAAIVLVDSRPFPSHEHWDTWPETHAGDPAVKQINRIRAWEQSGAKVLMSDADVADRNQMRELRHQVQEAWGKIDGVIHAAGFPDAGPIASQTRDRIGAVLRPKIHGALVLDEIFAGERLDFMVFCSSLISVVGEAEQAAYAAANAFLDSLARRNFFHNRSFTLSINWDTWEAPDNGTLPAAESAHTGIKPDEAVEVLRRLLRDKPGPQAIISTRDLALVARPKKIDTAEEKAGTAGRIYARPNLDRPIELPTNATEALLVPIWTEVLGVSPIGIDDDFFDLGGDSLIGLRMTARLEDLGVHVSIEQLFRHRTVQKLAGAVDQVELAEKIPAIIRVPRDQPIPLSYTQQRVWFIDRLTPGGSAYNIPASVRIRGSLNLALLERVLQEIVSRHESLRTRIEVVEGEPGQVIQDRISVPLPVIDLDSYPKEEREAAARRLARNEIQKPFDLQSGPLVRGCLLKLAEQDHVLVVTMHHVVSDGWSLGILVREVSALYKAFSAGEPSPLAELPIQYADYSVWQRQWVSGEMLEQQVNYWKNQLAEVSVLDLPTDFSRPLLQSQQGDTIEFNVSAELTVKLKQLSLQQGTTLYMTLLAAFQTLLSRYSRQQDIATGSPIAGRRRTETENLIGFFVNTLVLRTDLSGSPTFATLLQRIKKSTLEAYAHQDVPFEKLVEVLSPARDLSRSPLYQVMFALQNAPYSTLKLGSATLQSFNIHTVAAQCDLTLVMAEMSGGMTCSVEYSTDLFEAPTIARLIEQFKVLMEGIVADPEQSIAALPLLTPSERRQLVDEWNLTEATYPREKSLTDLFEEQAQRTPNVVAVSSEEGRLTYGELNAQANQIARYLRRLGVGPEAPVGMCIERSLEMVKGLLGILKAGGVYVPLDPAYPLERLLQIVADSKAPVTLIQERWVKELPPHSGRLVKVDAEWPQISQENQDNLHVRLDMANLAYVIYTSGSTGGPKGAMNTHGGILNRLLWMQERFGLKEDDRVLQKTPICFDISLWEFFWPLMVGAELVMAKPGGHLDAEYMAKVIEEKKITTLHFVPSALRMFLESAGPAKCASVRRVVCSGEVLSLDLQSAFFDRFESELHNLYGPTEAAVDATSWACEQDHGRQNVPIGKPVANVRIYVLDELMEPTPPGVPGELYIGGTGLARGYLGQAELTAQRFIASPFSTSPGERLYRTGDLARYLPDGNLEFLGRIDNQVKIGGHRIEPGEVEEIVQSHPAVQQAVVVVEEEKGIKRLIAYVVPRAGQVVNAFDLKGHVRRLLPEAMVPGVIAEIKEFPLTASGKIDRKRLPKVESIKVGNAENHREPRTEIERYIAEVVMKHLEVTTIGVDDNFFDMGGHSLLLTSIHARLATRFNDRITMIDLFTYPTIGSLAKYLERPEDDNSVELATQARANRKLQSFSAPKRGRRAAS